MLDINSTEDILDISKSYAFNKNQSEIYQLNNIRNIINTKERLLRTSLIVLSNNELRENKHQK